jgi:hypothetical protein
MQALRDSNQFGHRFQFISATYSKVIRPLFPKEFGHLFWVAFVA